MNENKKQLEKMPVCGYCGGLGYAPGATEHHCLGCRGTGFATPDPVQGLWSSELVLIWIILAVLLPCLVLLFYSMYQHSPNYGEVGFLRYLSNLFRGISQKGNF